MDLDLGLYLRTNSGLLYLTANSGTSSDWLAHWKHQENNAKYTLAALETPTDLLGGVWVSINDGDTWAELTINDKSIMNAGYMTCYKADTENKSDDTVIRVGGAGISSTEIVHFTDRYKAEEYREYTQVRLQNCHNCHFIFGDTTNCHSADISSSTSSHITSLEGRNYFVSSAVGDGARSNCDRVLTRIGELPIRCDGTDLQLNAIRFSYVIDNRMRDEGDTKYIASYVNFGTPIFGNYYNDTKAGKDCEEPSHQLEIDSYFPYQHSGESPITCPPKDYWYANIHKAESSAYEKRESSDTTDTTKDKYYNCVATYDNTGLFLAKLNSKKENIVEAYTGAIDKNLKAPSKYADDFTYPQEIVAQYDGFMAIANNKNEVQIRKASNSNDGFDKTVFDNSSFDRVMIAGVQPLDWHSLLSDRRRYNGRLIAIGQHDDQFLLKLYMLPTQSFAKRAKINGVNTIKCKIAGEPYAKVKYWFQQADSDGKFAQLTRSNIEARSSLIVYKNEANLDQDGSYSVNTYEPKQTGKYRLVTSAVVGGFYCDCDINQPDNIGTPSNDIDIKMKPGASKKIRLQDISGPDSKDESKTNQNYWLLGSMFSGACSGVSAGYYANNKMDNHFLAAVNNLNNLNMQVHVQGMNVHLMSIPRKVYIPVCVVAGATVGAVANLVDRAITSPPNYYVFTGCVIGTAVCGALYAMLYGIL